MLSLLRQMHSEEEVHVADGGKPESVLPGITAAVELGMVAVRSRHKWDVSATYFLTKLGRKRLDTSVPPTMFDRLRELGANLLKKLRTSFHKHAENNAGNRNW